MDSDRPFLEAIREQPDDDLHRLAWADWLEEHGHDERATFLRAQLACAGLDELDLARDAFEDQADDLLAVNETAWAGPVAERALDWRWSRGCIEGVTVWADFLLEHGDGLFATMPIRKVRILANEADLPRLAGCRWLNWVEHLEISSGALAGSPFAAPFFRDRALQTLLASPFLTRLTGLDLRGQGIEGPLLKTLIDTGILARLHSLDLTGNQSLGDRAARLLAESAGNRLEQLGVYRTNMTSMGLQSLLASKRMPALRKLHVDLGLLFWSTGFNSSRLDRELLQVPLVRQLTKLYLSGVVLTPGIVETLVVSEWASRLQELVLNNCHLEGEREVGILASAESLTGLRSLDLGGNGLRDRGVRALAGSPYLTSLGHLGLAGNAIGGPGFRALLGSPIVDRLRSLDLSGNHVGVPNISALARTPRPRLLTELDIGNANLDAECASILAESPAFSRLRTLRLENNPLRDAGVKVLANSPHLARLRSLGLDNIEIDSPGTQALLDSTRLGSVRYLSMRNSFISGREREQLLARYGPWTRF